SISLLGQVRFRLSTNRISNTEIKLTWFSRLPFSPNSRMAAGAVHSGRLAAVSVSCARKLMSTSLSISNFSIQVIPLRSCGKRTLPIFFRTDVIFAEQFLDQTWLWLGVRVCDFA